VRRLDLYLPQISHAGVFSDFPEPIYNTKAVAAFCQTAKQIWTDYFDAHTHTHTLIFILFFCLSVCFSVLSLIVSVSAFMRTAKEVVACCPNKYWVSVLATV